MRGKLPALALALSFRLAAPFIGAAQAPAPQVRVEAYPRADIDYGATIYTAECERCHGPTGEGVNGVNLRTGTFRRADSDAQLRILIQQGFPSTGMPQFRNFDAPQLTALVAYLRNMKSVDRGAMRPGDATRGKTQFEGGAECSNCHRVNGHGGRLGPDLSDIGSKRSAGSLERSLTDPSSQMFPINRPVRVVTRDGRTIQGRRLNEDTYTVQLSDQDGRLISLAKSDIREFTVSTTSNMPSYKTKLSAEQLGDMMAFLLSLKGS